MVATDWRALLVTWLKAYVTTNVYHLVPPGSPAKPFLVYQVIADPEIWGHHGPALVQLSAYATTSDGALAVRNAIRSAVEDHGTGIVSATDRIEAITLADDREDHDTVFGYRQDQDVHVLHVKKR